MKNPLRFQVTEFDCGTVSLLNAFTYLFKREEIPVSLIRAIHLYTLDCADENGVIGAGGTSKKAINKLTKWITNFANNNDFKIKCERFEGKDVTLDKFINCLNYDGCVFIRCWQEVEHYVIITKIYNGHVYIFDPYYLDKKEYSHDKDIKIILNKPFTHNRKVTLKRLFSEYKKDFSLGTTESRECVLISKLNK